MLKLSDRQIQILKAVVEEYIETAEPVGSETLDKKYHLGVCPATIRNEMVSLVEKGYLVQPYVSSGRIPTTKALKFYIHRLMEEQELGVTEEITVKEKIWDYKDEIDTLFQEATKALAEKTNSLAVSIANQQQLYHSGYSNILDIPEFFDIDVTKTVLSLIEDIDRLNSFFEQGEKEQIVNILIGDDFQQSQLQSCSLIFTNFRSGNKIQGTVGVFGPSRFDYPKVFPIVKYVGSLLEDILNSV